MKPRRLRLQWSESAEESSAEETTKAETAAESEETAEESEESTEAAAEKTEESEPAAEVAAEEAEPAAAEAVSGVTPASIYKTIGEKVALPSMMEGDDSFISNYYGINPADLDGYVFASAEDATLADSIIIMKAKSEDSVSAIVGSLNTIIEQKSAEMENYLPEQYDIVAKSSVKTEGSYVYLVISKDAGDIESVIQSALK
ncbi:DUF4358 domain-containing protein [Clostridium sp. AM58-1XD]|uniref:DUF4358 domain-containing protein n=1 Tax=Clostridium sp. AM58-1XD TaxID=2292307 RepID=UPI000E4E65F9|nr:DUF4358 domain-containing protein [Clostridium sp. AM58-1XD]RGY97819.1 DUF4358 domain-containing protein [Clostridium sp. AM58-1XD]